MVYSHKLSLNQPAWPGVVIRVPPPKGYAGALSAKLPASRHHKGLGVAIVSVLLVSGAGVYTYRTHFSPNHGAEDGATTDVVELARPRRDFNLAAPNPQASLPATHGITGGAIRAPAAVEGKALADRAPSIGAADPPRSLRASAEPNPRKRRAIHPKPSSSSGRNPLADTLPGADQSLSGADAPVTGKPFEARAREEGAVRVITTPSYPSEVSATDPDIIQGSNPLGTITASSGEQLDQPASGGSEKQRAIAECEPIALSPACEQFFQNSIPDEHPQAAYEASIPSSTRVGGLQHYAGDELTRVDRPLADAANSPIPDEVDNSDADQDEAPAYVSTTEQPPAYSDKLTELGEVRRTEEIAEAVGPEPRQQPTSPPTVSDVSRSDTGLYAEFVQNYPSVVVNGEQLGAVTLRDYHGGRKAIHLRALLTLLRSKMPVSEYERFSGAASANQFVDLEELNKVGLSVQYDERRERLLLSAK